MTSHFWPHDSFISQVIPGDLAAPRLSSCTKPRRWSSCRRSPDASSVQREGWADEFKGLFVSLMEETWKGGGVSSKHVCRSSWGPEQQDSSSSLHNLPSCCSGRVHTRWFILDNKSGGFHTLEIKRQLQLRLQPTSASRGLKNGGRSDESQPLQLLHANGESGVVHLYVHLAWLLSSCVPDVAG